MQLRTKLRFWLALISIILSGISPPVLATDFTLPFAEHEPDLPIYYISPLGGGNDDGSSPVNSLPLRRLAPFLQDLDHSAKIILTPGIYDLTSTLDLRAASPSSVLIVDGLNDATIIGNFDFRTLKGSESGLRLMTGNIIVRGVRFRYTGFCIKADKYAAIDQVLLEDIEATNVRNCILAGRSVQKSVSRWIIRNVTIQGYYQVGIRLSGHNSQDFLLSQLDIDGAQPIGHSNCYKAGIQLLRGVKNVTIRDSQIKNTIGNCNDQYQQGDGIEADHNGGAPENITIEDVQVSNSGDAELDLKAKAVLLKNVLAVGGEHSRYAFKVWEYDDYVCVHCYAYGMHKAYVNLNWATMTFRDPIFANDKPVHICDLRNSTNPPDHAEMKIEGGQIYVGNAAWLNECGNGVLADIRKLPQGKLVPPLPPSINSL